MMRSLAGSQALSRPKIMIRTARSRRNGPRDVGGETQGYVRISENDRVRASTHGEEMNTVSSSSNFPFPSYNDICRIEIIKFSIGGIDFHQIFAILWFLEVVGVHMWTTTPSTLQVTSGKSKL